MLVLWITLFSILGSMGAIISAATFLLIKEKTQNIMTRSLILISLKYIL